MVRAYRSEASLPAVSDTQPQSGIKRKLVLFVARDTLGKVTLARALLRAGLDVDMIESPDDLATAVLSGRRLKGIIVDADHPSASAIVTAVATSHPGLPLVLRGSTGRTKSLVEASGLLSVEVRPRESTAKELMDALTPGQ